VQTVEPASGEGVWLGTPGTPLQPAVPVLAAEAGVAPVAPASPVPAAEEPVSPLESAHDEVGESVVTWSVALRLEAGERIEIGQFGSDAEAKDHAQGVVRQLLSEHGWPFYDNRFIRPDAIVSVDLVRNEAGRWLGSSVRAQAWRHAN
jgi:hypothetical protein